MEVKSEHVSVISAVLGWFLGIITFAWRVSARITRIETTLEFVTKELQEVKQHLMDHDKWERSVKE